MENKDKFTPDQWRAVSETEGNMLVSASAGSGKTFVMIERLISLVLDGKARVSEILAVTFTEAAAAEMKQKLVSALRKRLITGGDNSKIREALEEVPSASISTIHKFCADILRAYFYEIGLDPTFRVADEPAADEIRNAAAENVFRDLYEQGDEDFLYLVRIFRVGRSDTELKNAIKKLTEFALSEKDPEAFIEKCGKSPTDEEFKELENAATEWLQERAAGLKISFGEMKTTLVSCGVKNTEKYFGEVFAKLDMIIGAKSLPEIVSLSSDKLGRAPSVSKELDAEKKYFDDLKKKLGKLFEDCSSLFPDGEETAKSAFLSTNRTVAALSKLTLLYKKEYDELKSEESYADFSDLEHLTYKLLSSSPDALKSVQSKYKYAFCDEYQDVNGVQEAILNLVAPDHLFMVGDVKQCIYAFRGCNPDIFAEKFARYDAGEGKAVWLSENFRSTEGVLAAVNKVFSVTMTEKNSGTDYASHPMVFGKLYPEKTGETFMHVITGEKDKKEAPAGVYNLVKDATAPENPDSFYEGLLVGELIEKELHTKIYDVKTKEEREVEPKDIVVLLRDSKGFATDVIKTLSRLNIPVTSVAKDPITEYPEIKLLTDVLKLIDFYADDAPLIATLKSSIGGLDEEELAVIRAETPASAGKSNGSRVQTPTFLDCVEYYKNNGKNEEIKLKLNRFDEYFKKIRLLAEFKGAGELLAGIIRDCSLDLEILTGRLGELRLERVNRFIAEAEKDGKKLSVREFLNKLENVGNNLAVSKAGGSNSVSVMSMHASKGLEFPVVIIAGLGRQFNAMDERENLLLSRKRCLAPFSYDEETMIKTDTIKRFVVKAEKRRDGAREELRLLYVAMTRAQSRLHLVSSADLPRERNEFTSSLARKFIEFFSERDMPVIFHDKDEIVNNMRAEKCEKILVGEERESLKKRILQGLDFVYPYESETVLPVKNSVTKITEEAGGTVGGENLFKAEKLSLSVSSAENGKVVFTLSDDTDAERNEVGTAYHKFLESRDFNEKSADNELIRQLSRGDLSERQAKLLDKNVLQKVMDCKLFGEIEGYEIYREQPFMANYPAEEVGYKSSGEILVQGVIDLLAISGDEAVIVDYKASMKNAEHVAEIYRSQLILYKKAVEKILKLKVKKAVILNLFTLETIEILDNE